MLEDFSGGLSPHWQRHVAGSGEVQFTNSTIQLITDASTARRYSDAQIDDYHHLSRRRFLWRPPLTMTVRARFSHPGGGGSSEDGEVLATELRGTAGFGFWNDPFLMSGIRLPALPRAVWFFYGSPPSNMKLDVATPGYGWKAATIDALRPVSLVLVPLAPAAILLMNIASLYRTIWPPIQRAINVQEALIVADTTQWHTYTIKWGIERSTFCVDGVPLLEDAPSPRGPLGFVMWLDNQYLVVTPQGRVRWGLLAAPGRQWLEAEYLSIEPTPRG